MRLRAWQMSSFTLTVLSELFLVQISQPLTYEGPGPAHEVDAAAAGQVHHAHRLEEASLRPQPAGGQTEDKCVEHREDDVEIKVGPLRNGAGNDGSS